MLNIRVGVMLIDVYSDVVKREFGKVVDRLSECLKECQCAADPYMRLELMELYVKKIREEL